MAWRVRAAAASRARTSGGSDRLASRPARTMPRPPPFGPAAFYLKGVVPAGITLGDIFRSILPYLVLQFLVLGILIAFPGLTLWLPGTMRN